MTTRRRGVFWPLLLISVGLVFLAANFGFLPPVSMLALLALWPLILIFIGVDIAVGRRSPLTALGIDLALLLAGLVLVTAQPSWIGVSWFAGAAEGQSDVAAPRDGASSLNLHLSGGAGRFTLVGGSSALAEAHSDASTLRLRRSGTDRATVRIDEVGGSRFGVRGSPALTIDSKVASDIPTSLDVSVGAGEFVLDLRDVKVTDARISAGASSLELTLPRPTGDVSVRISAGASSVVIEVPDGVEARVTTTGALMSLRSTSGRVTVNGGVAETVGYGAARDRVTVTVSAGASSVVVR